MLSLQVTPISSSVHNSVYSREYKIFQELLRLSREEAGVSQNELAKRLLITQGYVSKCESGDLRLDIAQVRAFCEAMGVSFVDFMTRYDQAVEDERNG